MKKQPCPACGMTTESPRIIWRYTTTDLRQCAHCGLVFHANFSSFFHDHVATIYSLGSWGTQGGGVYSIENHLARLTSTLKFATPYVDLSSLRGKKILDVGSGIGLAIDAIEAMVGSDHGIELTLIEPAEELSQLLIDKFPSATVIPSHVNALETLQQEFDLILCLGVDYLFEDIERAFRTLSNHLTCHGTMIVSRNVFLDMPCYFGGAPILSCEDLFSPNPLINAYFLESHYQSFLKRNFQLLAHNTVPEYHAGQLIVEMSNYVLQRKDPTTEEKDTGEEFLQAYTDKINSLTSTELIS